MAEALQRSARRRTAKRYSGDGRRVVKGPGLARWQTFEGCERGGGVGGPEHGEFFRGLRVCHKGRWDFCFSEPAAKSRLFPLWDVEVFVTIRGVAGAKNSCRSRR